MGYISTQLILWLKAAGSMTAIMVLECSRNIVPFPTATSRTRRLGFGLPTRGEWLSAATHLIVRMGFNAALIAARLSVAPHKEVVEG